jgi:hypothetical protein
MADDQPDTRSASTTWEWRTVRIARPPKAASDSRPKGGHTSLRTWEPRDPLTITVVYRGGGECWYQVVSRGRTLRFPGAMALHDVMRAIYKG